MERHLTREGFAVVTASGGHEGLRLARELHPAAITLDIMMPDLDGWTVLAAIKGDPELADIPVIFVTVLGINLILKQGAMLVCTNPDHSVDATIEGEHWVLPGGGALVAPFAAATGVAPVFIGKPEPLLYRMALQRLNVRAKDCLMVGDRPDTDIAGAAALGMKTALVRTGRFAPGQAFPEALHASGLRQWPR